MLNLRAALKNASPCFCILFPYLTPWLLLPPVITRAIIARSYRRRLHVMTVDWIDLCPSIVCARYGPCLASSVATATAASPPFGDAPLATRVSVTVSSCGWSRAHSTAVQIVNFFLVIVFIRLDAFDVSALYPAPTNCRTDSPTMSLPSVQSK